jgi:N-acetylglucosaminyldiphosphoundecaprenol N-acetyl-beta-D-mannosaminyltransferase
MGLVYGSWIAGTPIRSRVTGRRLPAAVGARLGQAGLGIALVSWRPSVLARAARRLEASGSRVAAAVTVTTDPADGSVIDESVVEALRRSEARAVFAAVGSPEQEVWMATHAPRVPYALFAGVGSAVDVLGGRVREAPAWMTSVGLEWFFRLAQEPQRLAGRYLRDDPPFFVWMLRERVRRRSTRGDRAR